LAFGDSSGRLEHVYLQGSLLGLSEPEVDPSFAGIRRHALDDSSWVDHLPGWLRGDELVFDQLYHGLSWNHRTVTMYDRRLPEPRLTSWWTPDQGPEPFPILAEIRAVLSSRYGETFDSIGFNCYRDGADSVAWHGDRHRHTVDDPIVATVSVGAARPFRLRPRRGRPTERAPASRAAMGFGGAAPARDGPRRGGRSHSFELGRGDLLVMGGACQHDWEHTVPKARVVTGPRISITFRHGAR
jgi:alkylated DNA repair dioxygenase AlkB